MPAPRVLITRSPHQASALADQLRAHGADPILIPTIELADPTTFAPLDAALAHLDHFHWLLFTSANAVEAFHRRLTHPAAEPGAPGLASETWVVPSENQAPAKISVILSEGQSPQPKDPDAANPTSTPCPFPPLTLPANLRIAAIGAATARALEAAGLHAELLPPQAVAESLAEALLPHALQPDGTPTRFLLLRAETARELLPDTLRAPGADVTIAPAYRTIVPTESIAAIRQLFSTRENWPAAITFTSSSTATNFIGLLEVSNLSLPQEILRISIGPITSQTLCDLNLPPHAEAAEPSLPSLVAEVVKALTLTKSS
ncbi:uroporphyrinogen-III synthase [Granulicella sp. L46]|uniref:uroporphyrinogen-III synthase n=1 Tax=Granulicella sp. L46 TaxID=1641865 RepID=UPI00131BE303|nr:uroporphyrinogen-III synthase [Granulicella sp. L46]